MALCRLLKRVESDSAFYQELKEAGARRKEQFSLQKERESWERLFEKLR